VNEFFWEGGGGFDYCSRAGLIRSSGSRETDAGGRGSGCNAKAYEKEMENGNEVGDIATAFSLTG
jgi:hypothetical protein